MNETGKLGKGLISVIVLLALVLLVFFFRLFDFQVVKGDYYVSVQNSTNIYSTTIEAARGEILDRNGIPLATSRVGYNVVIDKNFYSLDTINDIILSLTEMLAVEGEEHNGTLPIELSGDSYVFTAGMEEDISSLKDRLGPVSYTHLGACVGVCQKTGRKPQQCGGPSHPAFGGGIEASRGKINFGFIN